MKESDNITAPSRSSNKTENLKVVVLCVIAATTFWIFLALGKDYPVTIDYPILIDFDQEQYISKEELPSEIQINVTSLGWNILRKGYFGSTSPIYSFINNPDKLTSLSSQDIQNDVVTRLGDEMTLNYIVNDSILIDIDQRITKRCYLYIDSGSVDLRESHFITSIIGQSIDSVSVSGPRSIIEEHSDTLWVRVEEPRIDESFNDNIGIYSSNDLISVYPSQLNVRFDVERFISVDSKVNVKLQNFPEDSTFTIIPPIAAINYSVSENDIERVTPDQFEVVAMFDRMVPYDSTIQPLILNYPEGIKNVNITSSRIQVVKKLTSGTDEQ